MPVRVLGRGARPAPSAPIGLCFVIEESQDFDSTSFRNALDSQLLVVGRLKSSKRP